MEDKSSQLILTINEKLKDARQSDLRFFRIDEFKRNIERVEFFSGKCPICTKEFVNIRNVAGNIHLAIGTPGKERREYDGLINRLALHLQKEHGYFAPYHFTYRYTFYGLMTGLIFGFLLMTILSDYNWSLVSAGFSLGMLLGYIYGGQKDRKIRDQKMLM